jgi:4a-hydroxytetrahydrobiopterin dehydratase
MASLSDADIEQRLASTPRWRLSGDAAIEREWKLANFKEAIEFVNEVGKLAEEANHHPDIRLHGWNKVALTLSTHSEGGLTEADFKLAARIDALAP